MANISGLLEPFISPFLVSFVLRRRKFAYAMPFVLLQDPHPRIAQFSPGIIDIISLG